MSATEAQLGFGFEVERECALLRTRLDQHIFGSVTWTKRFGLVAQLGDLRGSRNWVPISGLELRVLF